MTDDDDDDLVHIRRKIPKLDDSITPTESEACSICFQAFTTCGDHKIVSIDCGHVFGLKCIEIWYKQQQNCPMCKRRFTKKGIRPMFLNIKAIAMEDNSELISALDVITKLKEDQIKSQDEISSLRLNYQLQQNENTKLQEKITELLEMNAQSNNPYQKIGTSNKGSNFFKFQHKIQISAIGNCRVMDYSHLDNNICVSCPSSVRIVTGYGVRVIDLAQMKSKKFINIHSDMIRNVEFSRFYSTNIMLSCSMDKHVKLTSTHNNSVVGKFLCSNPVWSCTWSNNNNIIYAGLNNGVINEIDIRNTSSAVNQIFSRAGGPIVSLQYICGNEYLKNNGLLVTNSTGVIFLHNSLSECESSLSLANSKMDTILMSSTYNSSLIHTAFNRKTYNLLSTFRPNEKSKLVRYLFSEIGSITGDSESFYGSEVKSLYGGTEAQFISRSCFLTDRTNDAVNYAVASNELDCSVKVWDLNSYKFQVIYPSEVTPKKPIIDTCQYSSDPVSFVSLNCDNLYFYRFME